MPISNSQDCFAEYAKFSRLFCWYMPNSHDCSADKCRILTIFCWYMPNSQFFSWYIPNSHNCFADISKILTIVVLIYAQCSGAATFRVEPEPRAVAAFFKAAPAASFWQAKKVSLVLLQNMTSAPTEVRTPADGESLINFHLVPDTSGSGQGFAPQL